MYEQPRTVPWRRGIAHSSDHNSSHHSQSKSAPAAHGARLAGHLAALLAATESVRAVTADVAGQAALEVGLAQIRARLTELKSVEARRPVAVRGARTAAELHEQAQALAGRLLVVAAAQQDTTTAMLACRRMDAHAAALKATA